MAEQKQTRREEGGKGKGESSASSIIRLAGRDVNGSLSIERALFHVRGIGVNMAHALSHAVELKLGVQRSTSIGSLDEQRIAAIEAIIKDPVANGIPSYMVDHRKNFENGNDVHYVGNDLLLAMRQDISRDVTLRTWRGYRHQYGQRVRGQRTRSTGRTGATVGVMKKAAKEMAQAAEKAEKAEKAPKGAKPAAAAPAAAPAPAAK